MRLDHPAYTGHAPQAKDLLASILVLFASTCNACSAELSVAVHFPAKISNGVPPFSASSGIRWAYSDMYFSIAATTASNDGSPVRYNQRCFKVRKNASIIELENSISICATKRLKRAPCYRSHFVTVDEARAG